MLMATKSSCWETCWRKNCSESMAAKVSTCKGWIKFSENQKTEIPEIWQRSLDGSRNLFPLKQYANAKPAELAVFWCNIKVLMKVIMFHLLRDLWTGTSWDCFEWHPFLLFAGVTPWPSRVGKVNRLIKNNFNCVFEFMDLRLTNKHHMISAF